MVSKGMRRYKNRTADQAAFIADPSSREPLDPEAVFGRMAPWRLELGFGHGEFISQLAEVHPDEDHVGVEHNELRVTKTAHKCHKAGLNNVHLSAGDAHTFLRYRVPPAILNRAYVLFSDPWPKMKHRRRRLINRAFLLDMAWAMAPGGKLMIASDTHNYALGVLSHLSTLPGLWRYDYAPQGYRFNIPTRFPTLFERYKKEEGCAIAYVLVTRTDQAPAPRVAMRNGDDDIPLAVVQQTWTARCSS